ncbi:hypothetical protein [Archangium sp.]|uniref:hypothetical protein n=1 Tax=Archangium sp. TaxID=1872627 RepID=UPI00286B02DE|nr:hypothetical protein [Archangium sp.]
MASLLESVGASLPARDSARLGARGAKRVPTTRQVRYPLALVSPHGHSSTNSTFGSVPQRFEKGPLLEVHPADAAPRAIVNGERE